MKPHSRLCKIICYTYLLTRHFTIKPVYPRLALLWSFLRHTFGQTIGFIINGTTELTALHRSVPLVIVDRYYGFVYTKLEVVGSETMALRISIGECSTLQQFVRGKLDSGYNIGGAKSRLLYFGEEIIGIPV
jgi:hypothetical protein